MRLIILGILLSGLAYGCGGGGDGGGTLIIAIAAPSNLTAQDTPADSGGSITVTWVPSTSTDVTEHRLFRSTQKGGPYDPLIVLSSAAAEEYKDDSVTNGQEYFYVVRASNGADESPNSNEARAVPVDNFTVDSLRVTPDFAAVPVGGLPQAFVAEALDAGGGVIGGKTFLWSLENSDPADGSIDPNTGVYTSPNALPAGSNRIVIEAMTTDAGDPKGVALMNLLTGPDLVFDPEAPVSGSDTPNDIPFTSNRSIAVSEDRVYVIWANPDDNNVYLAVSSDKGKTFQTPPLRVNAEAGNTQGNPVVGADSFGNVYVAWEDKQTTVDGPDSDIFFRKGVPAGGSISFQDEVVVNDDVFSSGMDHDSPSLAVDGGGNVYVAWVDPRNGSFDIYFSKGTSDSNGQINFSANKRVSASLPPSIDFSDDPSIAVDGSGNVYVAWTAIDADPGGNSFIYAAKGTEPNGQIAFQSPVLASDTNSMLPLFPSVAADRGGKVYVAWEDFRGGDAEIFVGISEDGGVNFGPNVNITNTVGEQFLPSLSVDLGGNVYLSWEDERAFPNDGVYFAKKMASAADFGMPVKVSQSLAGADQGFPSLALDAAGRAFVLWVEEGVKCTPGSSGCLFFSRGD